MIFRSTQLGKNIVEWHSAALLKNEFRNRHTWLSPNGFKIFLDSLWHFPAGGLGGGALRRTSTKSRLLIPTSFLLSAR
jgi:hypothetical protein